MANPGCQLQASKKGGREGRGWGKRKSSIPQISNRSSLRAFWLPLPFHFFPQCLKTEA